jgi:hypothetical protein
MIVLLLLPAAAAGADEASLASVKARVLCPEHCLNKKVAVLVGAAPGASAASSRNDPLYPQVQGILEGKLLELGFRPISQSTLQAQISQKQKLLLVQGDAVAAATLGERLGADLLLLGHMSTQTREITVVDTTMQSVYLQLGLQLVETGSYTLLASFTLSEKSAGADLHGAVLKIVQEEAEAAAAKLYEQYCLTAPNVFQSPASEPPSTRGQSSTPSPPQGQAGGAPSDKDEPSSAPATSSLEDL